MPSDTDLQPLVGEELRQICLDPHGLQFKFEKWELSIQFDVEHVEPDGTCHRYNCTANDGPPLFLHRLLQISVTSVEREELVFKLHFDDGSILVIHTELGPYECGQLYKLEPPSAIIVF